ncbi:hypothetical protein G5I_11583 [Acromyrmex echinatior]|uniref:Uncharacterized protein n=1 Tax=Acromyrmex echinatior TaxID=103372 RepID=F4X002_ACREC|nr:hypothetical protein G5I_11583 [Acromyrmex echinatior]
MPSHSSAEGERHRKEEKRGNVGRPPTRKPEHTGHMSTGGENFWLPKGPCGRSSGAYVLDIELEKELPGYPASPESFREL